MKVFIRTDASAAIGAGHLMRCLALADELAARGSDVRFVTRAAADPWGQLVRQHGHRVLQLTAGAVSWAQDLGETRAALAGADTADWLIVDHYALGQEWEDGMRSHARKILAIDDLDRPHASDLSLYQNIIGDTGKAPASEKRALFGPRYALLRAEFEQARRTSRTCDGDCRKVLINFGGSDPAGATKRAIEAFLMAALPRVKAHVVLGAANPEALPLRQRYANHPQLEISDTTNHMAAAMASADLAIGAGGISTWERASLGLPSLVIAVAENQMAIAEQLGVLGSHIYLGRSEEVDAAYLAANLTVLANNRGLRTALARSSAALCDGLGVRRVADRLVPPPIKLRRASLSDSAKLHAWRNAEPIRRVSGNSAPIDFAAHQHWLEKVLADDTRHLLIGEDGQGAVGVVRFDIADNRASISIYLVPERIGSGLGLPLLLAAQDWLAIHEPAIEEIGAHVLTGNPRSATMFEHAGYRLMEQHYRKPLEKSSGKA